MGRKKIEIEKIQDERDRRVTFKKRRIGLLKKAIQLSKLTDATVMLKVFNKEDSSLIEYYSKSDSEFDNIVKTSQQINQYSKFANTNYDLVCKVEEKVTKHGHPNCLIDDGDLNFLSDLERQIDGINTLQLFSLTKKNQQMKRRIIQSSKKVNAPIEKVSDQESYKRQKNGSEADKEKLTCLLQTT